MQNTLQNKQKKKLQNVLQNKLQNKLPFDRNPSGLLGLTPISWRVGIARRDWSSLGSAGGDERLVNSRGGVSAGWAVSNGWLSSGWVVSQMSIAAGGW